jgi:type IV secretion system protein VirD4
MLEKEEREFSSVLSTAKRSLTLYSDPLVSRTVVGHDFTVTDLVQHERPVSLYLVVPPSDYERLIPLIRLVINLILNRLTEGLHFQGSTQLTNKHRLLFMIDEFPSLKQMNIFANALSYMGGYGLKAFLITQDIKQIVNEYGPNQSITSNCHIRIAYTPNEIDTAELLSRHTGIQTITKADFSFSGSRLSPIKSQMNQSVHQIQRPLMTPDEILKLTPPQKQTNDENSPILKPGKMLILVSGMSPILGEQMLYFFDPVLWSRAALPPPERLPRIARQDPKDVRTGTDTSNPRSDGSPQQMVMNLSAPPSRLQKEL